MAAKQTLLFLMVSACIVAIVKSQCKVDFVMILDGSGSICNNQGGTCQNWLDTLSFVRSVIDGMAIGPDDSRVALITFGSIGNLIWPLDRYTDKASLLAAVDAIKYLDEKTNTSHALDLARTDVFGGDADRPGVPNVAIVLTDGLPSNITDPFVDGRGLARAAANRLKNSGVQVITIGVTNQIDSDLLRDMSSPPQELNKNYFTSADFSKLDAIIEDIIEATCVVVVTTTTAPVVGSCLVDFGFLVDSSGSICNNQGGNNCENWASVRNFLKAVVQNMRIEETGSRVGMILFGSYAEILWQLNTYSTEAALVNRMENLKFLDETTNTTYALHLARTQLFGSEDRGDRPNVPNVAIILTDGKPTGDVATAAKAARELRDSGVRIISIGVTREISEELLMNMSSAPRVKDQDYFTSPDFDKLNSLLLGIINSACLAPSTTPPPDLTCRLELDIIVVLDASGSIRESNFEKAKAFLADTVGQLDITSGRTRVGLVTYGTGTSLRFHLSQYSSSNDVKQAILDTPYTHGTTNTAAALRYVADTMYTSNNGDRSNVADLVVILTDGGSNDQEATVTQGLRLKAKGVHILAVGIGNWLNKVELESIASHPDSRNVLYISSYDGLGDHSNTFISFMCGSATPCNSNPCQNGGSCRNHLDGIYMCHCPENYGGVNCQYRCMEPSDVIFALDASGSITSTNFKKVVDFAKNVVLDLPVDARMRVGLETFSNNEKIYFNLKDFSDRSLLLNAMTIPYFSDGTTNTARALEVMRNDMFTSGNGDQSNVPNVGIVITDGRSNNPRDTWAQAISTRNQNIDLIAIGVGGNIDNSELRAIASDPVDKNIFIASNFDGLDSLLSQVRNSVCKTPVCDSNPCQNGGTCNLLRNGYSCQCTQDRTGNNCERNCPGAADVVIALDVSGSIRQERFADVLEFFVGVVENLEVYNDKVRVGALTFSDSATLQFRLNERSTRQDVIQSLRTTPYTGGRTNIADAIKMAREELFVESRGDRQDAPNFLILFTDGAANIRAESTIAEAIESRIAGIHTIVIGIGKDLNYVEMESIASFPASENVKTIDSFTKMNALSNYVELATCNSENQCQNNPCQSGGTCTDALGFYLCTCQDHRTGRNCERDCQSQRDVVFLMDFSGSVDETYMAIVAFLRETVYGLPFRFGRTRVAILSYSDDVTVMFHLNQFSEQRDVLNAIAFYRNGGRTNTQEALRVARETMLTSGNGDRSSVDNIVVLLTDGGSNIQRDMTSQRARELRDSPSTSVHVVAIGDRVDMSEVNDIVGGDGNKVYRMADENAAVGVAKNLLDRIC